MKIRRLCHENIFQLNFVILLIDGKEKLNEIVN